MPEQSVRLQTSPDAVRENLQDLVNLAAALSSVCQTTQELVEVCELALRNDAQLSLVMNAIKQTSHQQTQRR